nr:MAG TPA: Thaumarchaeal output domain 1 [Caudoviricetes sp.]
MSRYIDAEKLKCSIDSETDSIFDWDMTIEELYYNLCKLIDDEPTADVQPVKRGTWENTNTPNQLRCSNCEIIHFIAQYPHGEINYCPNCGARMDSDSSIADIINEQPTADVQEVKHGYWKFHEKTKLVPANKVGIKEEYTNGHDCTVVDNTNVNKKIMIMKKHITVRVPVCSVCGWYGHDECDATPYCPNCGARMDGDSSIADIINEQPAADVQEVKRGYWQNKYRSGTTIKEGVVSSCCDMWNNRKSQFCPNCGARMDGDNNG